MTEGGERRVLFCGATTPGQGGTWQLRGIAMAETRAHWSAIERPTPEDVEAHDVVVVVKWGDPELLAHARKAGKKVVWDACNIYAQITKPPVLVQSIEAGDVVGLTKLLLRAQPADAVLVANDLMRHDFTAAGARAFAVPHALRTDMRRRQGISDGFRTLVYGGPPEGLTEAASAMVAEVGRRVGIEGLTEAGETEIGIVGDAAFMARPDDRYRWLHARWAPATHTVSALAAGIPMITPPEASALEVSRRHPGVLVYWDKGSLLQAIATCRYEAFRQEVLAGSDAVAGTFAPFRVADWLAKVIAAL